MQSETRWPSPWPKLETCSNIVRVRGLQSKIQEGHSDFETRATMKVHPFFFLFEVLQFGSLRPRLLPNSVWEKDKTATG